MLNFIKKHFFIRWAVLILITMSTVVGMVDESAIAKIHTIDSGKQSIQASDRDTLDVNFANNKKADAQSTSETASPQPTPIGSETASPQPTSTGSETASPQPTPTGGETASPQPTPTGSETASPQPTPIGSETASPQPDYTASVETDRANGICLYTVNGIDVNSVKHMILKVYYNTEDGSTVRGLEKSIDLDSSNVTNGTYKGSFEMTDLDKYLFEMYNVSFVMGDTAKEIQAGQCDFTIHSDNYKLEVSGQRYDINRTFEFKTENADDVSVPGKGNKIKLVIWKSNSDISKAEGCGIERELTDTQKTWEMDLSTICKSYGTYNAGIVLINSNLSENYNLIVSSEFKASLVYSNVNSKKSASLEKKKAFRVYVSALNSALGVKSVKFALYNKSNELVCSKAGVRKANRPYYYADIKLKAVSYKLEVYTIKVTVTDTVGNKRVLSKTGTADERIGAGTLTVQKNSDSTCSLQFSDAYVPGNIKKIKFEVYSVKSGKETFVKRIKVASNSKNIYTADFKYSAKGKYRAYVYATSNWGESILLNKKAFSVKKEDLGKNGWVYEKYAGKEYKFYYKNNEKVTDLTDILGLNKTNNNLYIEINRAACCVNVYAYDSEKKDYIIPVKTFTVSVGRDIYSTGSASALNEESSFTPLGTYSVSSNGIAAKYTLKTMNEPDGSVVYARWATHIVGNVYFHAVAVGSQSHYALSPTNYNKLGSPASAGCIRMTVIDAKWIYDYASLGTKVEIVKGDASKPGPFGKNATITVDSTIHYDPTDPEVPNSTKKKDYSAGHISGYITKAGKRVGY